MFPSKQTVQKTAALAFRIWFFTGLIFSVSFSIYSIFESTDAGWLFLVLPPVSLVASLPVAVALIVSLIIINTLKLTKQSKILLLSLACIICCIPYGAIGFLLLDNRQLPDVVKWLIIDGALICSALFSLQILAERLTNFFSTTQSSILKQHRTMETSTDYPEHYPGTNERSNKILFKSLITGGLILIMLIPTLFIMNLVKERQERQSKVTAEVSDRWAKAQILSGPYIFLPYKFITIGTDKKPVENSDHLVIIPDNLDVNGQVSHEFRLRSIYKVLLYKANLKNSGNFEFKLPKDIDKNLVQWQDAKICYSLSDFKGIEERLIVNFNGADYELSPGLPSEEISKLGLSATIPLTATDEGKKMAFNMNLKIKGSEQLHFVPLSGDSRFSLKSAYANPSFDGNNLPSERTVNDSGFTASWSFNKANLPFGTVLQNFKFDLETLAFGVTLVQPADGYAKTDRCIKYAILFIGLTFSLFFIIELMQKKPVHPVQYILVGLALIIFYTLLLSISEFIVFDLSYLIAATATVSLITAYSYSHFKSGKTAGTFGGVLVLLYSFTFVLIRLEDTALLIGSIGLFIILALAMYASRRINWYGNAQPILNAEKSF